MKNNNQLSTTSVLPFIILFISSMIGHELALESLSTTYQENFVHISTSITLFQFGFCVLLPAVVSLYKGGDVIQSFPRSLSQFWIYIKLSILVYGATAFATMSLAYEGVSYVTKVVFKSAKLIPTMIVGVVLDKRAESAGQVVANKKHYNVWEYGSAALLCVGAMGFAMSPNDLKSGDDGGDDAKEETAQDASSSTESSQVQLGGHSIGISLLLISVLCDALVPNLQQQLMAGTSPKNASSFSKKNSDINGHERKDSDVELEPLVITEDGEKQSHATTNSSKVTTSTSSQQGLSSQALMVNTNTIGFTLLLLSTVAAGSIFPIITYLVTNFHFLILHVCVGMGLGTAVLAYTELIRRAGPAVAVGVATLRKVFTILLSYIFFPKPMTPLHMASAALVICGLGVSYAGRGRK